MAATVIERAHAEFNAELFCLELKFSLCSYNWLFVDEQPTATQENFRNAFSP
jgi:hypothetical protein